MTGDESIIKGWVTSQHYHDHILRSPDVVCRRNQLSSFQAPPSLCPILYVEQAGEEPGNETRWNNSSVSCTGHSLNCDFSRVFLSHVCVWVHYCVLWGWCGGCCHDNCSKWPTGHYCLVQYRHYIIPRCTAVNCYCRTISCGYSHSFYHTECFDGPEMCQREWPPQGGRASPGSWGQPWPTGQGEDRTGSWFVALLLVSILSTCFTCFFGCALWKQSPVFCGEHDIFIAVYTAPLLLSII